MAATGGGALSLSSGSFASSDRYSESAESLTSSAIDPNPVDDWARARFCALLVANGSSWWLLLAVSLASLLLPLSTATEAVAAVLATDSPMDESSQEPSRPALAAINGGARMVTMEVVWLV